MLETIPNSQSLKVKHAFSRTDLIQIFTEYRKKHVEMEELVTYEQKKSTSYKNENEELLKQLKVAKLDKKILEKKLKKIDELEFKLKAYEERLVLGMDMLKKSMIQNFVCLEFNKDLLDLTQDL